VIQLADYLRCGRRRSPIFNWSSDRFTGGSRHRGAENSLELQSMRLRQAARLESLGKIFYGPSLETMFNAPGLPAPFGHGDPRAPDIIVQPNVGVVYTGSSKKQAEHGGFAHDDTNMMMLLSNPRFTPSTVTSFVETMQVAPTILEALGLDPNRLDASKRKERQLCPE
jgi:hypothetical protein